MADLEACITDICSQPIEDLLPEIDADAVTALTFSDCIPPEMAERMLQRRAVDRASLAAVLAKPVRCITPAG